METTITATELARNLSDVLNRARYRGERFRVERNGELVAIIEPPTEPKKFTVADLIREFGDLKMPEGMGDAIEEVTGKGSIP